MKIKTQWIPVFTLAAGAVGLALRLWLFGTGIDEKGLLMTEHPANALTFILTAIVMAGLLIAIRPLKPVRSYKRLFQPSWVAMTGCLLAAAGILVTAFSEIMERRDPIIMTTQVLAVLSVGCLILLAFCRKKGMRPNLLLQSLLTLYLILHLVCQYRLWSAEPQLQVYFFPLLASVFLMLTVFHGAVLDTQKGSRRWYVFCNQAALFCCCLSLNSSLPFYLSMGIFCATNLCSLQTKNYRPKYIKEAE